MKIASPISCSISSDHLYNLSYSYEPQQGVTVSCFFVNQAGNYTKPTLDGSTKSIITIGPLVLQMLPVTYEIQYQYGRRVLKVDFVDETHILGTHMAVQVGRGCGTNVHQMGKPLNPAQLASTDPNDQVRFLTQFQDLEYPFTDFITELNKVMKVIVSPQATFDATITKGYWGTFDSVLSEWCSFYGFTWYVENGAVNIINIATAKLTIDSSLAPSDAIEYEESGSIKGTYANTTAFFFNQEGNNYVSTRTATRSATLYPIGTDANVPQILPDLNQVAAALYGRSFWFLYNYVNGTASTQCGWTPANIGANYPATNISRSLTALKQGAINTTTGFPVPSTVDVAVIDEAFFEQQFQAYQEYGQKVAGKLYMSDKRSDVLSDGQVQWFNVTSNSIVNFNSAFAQALKVQIQVLAQQGNTSRDVIPPNFSDVFPSTAQFFTSVIPDTVINKSFPGVNFTGDRLLYVDGSFPDTAQTFAIDPAVSTLADALFELIFNGVEGTSSLDYSEIAGVGNNSTTKRFACYYGYPLPAQILALVAQIPQQVQFLKPTYNQVNIQGVAYSQTKPVSSNQLKVTSTVQGNIVTDSATLQAAPAINSNAYYTKYSKCVSASSAIGDFTPFGRKFNFKDISNDIPILPSILTTSQNAYVLQRDITYLNLITASPLLQAVAVGRTFPSARVSFSLNYFYPQLVQNPVSSGLVGLSVSIGDNGVTSSYTFSNDILNPPYTEAFVQKLEQAVKNSWIRTYNPTAIAF